jgi:hypothetical protein
MTSWLDLSTAERQALLRPLASQGHSYSGMVTVLSKTYGQINRRSIIGLCQRGGIAVARGKNGWTVPEDALPDETLADLPWRSLPPEVKTAAVRKLAAQGLSAGQIAGRLSLKHGRVSRGAVIGVVSRAGIRLHAADSRRVAPEKISAKARATKPGLTLVEASADAPVEIAPAPVAASEAPARPAPELLPEEAQPVTLFELTARSCSYPVSHDPRGIASLFCGAPKVRGSYCACHARRVYTTAAALKAELQPQARPPIRPMRAGALDFRRTA